MARFVPDLFSGCHRLASALYRAGDLLADEFYFFTTLLAYHHVTWAEAFTLHSTSACFDGVPEALVARLLAALRRAQHFDTTGTSTPALCPSECYFTGEQFIADMHEAHVLTRLLLPNSTRSHT